MKQVDLVSYSGKRRSCHFSKLFEESIDSIFRLMIVTPPYSVNFLGDVDLEHLRIRLTEYSKVFSLEKLYKCPCSPYNYFLGFYWLSCLGFIWLG